MRIGIYLAYGPMPGLSLKQEGLGRYLSELIRALEKNGDKIVIATPEWTQDAIYELIEEFRIPGDNIEYLSTDVPVIYKLYLYFINKRKRKKKKIKSVSTTLIDKILNLFFTIKSYVAFIFFLFIFSIIAIMLFPVWLFLLCTFLAIVLLKKIINKLGMNFGQKVVWINILQKIKKHSKLANAYHQYFCDKFSSGNIQSLLRKNVADSLINRIDFMKFPVDIWYCPTAFWPEFNLIRGKKVVCVPDLLTEEFAMNFSEYQVAQATKEVRETVVGGKYYITYCNYIKNVVLVNKYRKNSDDICVITHAVNETLPYLNIKQCFKNVQQSEKDMIDRYSRMILGTLVSHCPEMKDYLGNTDWSFDFKNIQYIFYSAQGRPSKNIMNLIKAYEYLLRERNIQIKLFLTCNLAHYKPLYDYVYEHNLQYDILCFKAVSNQQLAALYRCAILIVTPTLYEGGFPFTFGEGMSVGTPSIMGNIPQVKEVFYGTEWDMMLFDPYDYLNIASRIIFGLDNFEYLYEKQKKVYDKMAERSWQKVGLEYVKAFQYFLKKDEARHD